MPAHRRRKSTALEQGAVNIWPPSDPRVAREGGWELETDQGAFAAAAECKGISADKPAVVG